MNAGATTVGVSAVGASGVKGDDGKVLKECGACQLGLELSK